MTHDDTDKLNRTHARRGDAMAPVLSAPAERLQIAIGRCGMGVWEYSPSIDQLSWDSRTVSLHGDPKVQSRLSLSQWIALVHADDQIRVKREFDAAMQAGAAFELEFRVVWPNGSVHHLRIGACYVPEQHDHAPLLTGIVWDVTQMRRLSNAVEEQNELLRITLQSIGDAVIITDPWGHVDWLNRAAEMLLGWSTQEAHGKHLNQVFITIDEESRERLANPATSCIEHGRSFTSNQRTLLIARDGQEHCIEDSASPIRNRQHEILGVVLVFRDVTAQRKLSGEMRYRATHDPLTGFLNRTEFEAHLRASISTAHEENKTHVLMYLDLDHFKAVNDTCGHATGDRLLKEICKLMTDTVRANDTLARMGGDEFAILLEGCDRERGMRIGEQICQRIERYEFVHEHQRFHVGASIGLVAIDRHWQTPLAILEAADAACYEAKQSGRNRVCISDSGNDQHPEKTKQASFNAQLEHLVTEGQLSLYAQAIVGLDTPRHRRRFELLVRLRDEQQRLVLPAAFMPNAERLDLCPAIDEWVLCQALHYLTHISSPAPNVDFHINVSTQAIINVGFIDRILDHLHASAYEARASLCMEIPETCVLQYPTESARFIRLVKACGIQILIDQFGLNTPAPTYLRSFPIDMIKLPPQLIKNLPGDPIFAMTARHACGCALHVGAQIVASHLEEASQVDSARELKVHYLQGHIIHEPIPLTELDVASISLILPSSHEQTY